MAPQDPRFWEVCVDPTILASLAEEAGQRHRAARAEEDEADRRRRRRLVRKAIGQIRNIIETRLTAKQQQVVELFFFEGKTQEDIAKILQISQQVVSKHLFGAVRGGRKIGGAVRKLRKICREEGIDPETWV